MSDLYRSIILPPEVLQAVQDPVAAIILSRLNNLLLYHDRDAKPTTEFFCQFKAWQSLLPDITRPLLRRKIQILLDMGLIHCSLKRDRFSAKMVFTLKKHPLNQNLQESYKVLYKSSGTKCSHAMEQNVHMQVNKMFTCNGTKCSPIVSNRISKKQISKKQNIEGRENEFPAVSENSEISEICQAVRKTENGNRKIFKVKLIKREGANVDLKKILSSSSDDTSQKTVSVREAKTAKKKQQLMRSSESTTAGVVWLTMWFDMARAAGYNQYIRENTREARRKMSDLVKSHFESDYEPEQIRAKLQAVVSGWERLRKSQIAGLYGRPIVFPQQPIFDFYYAHRQYIDGALNTEKQTVRNEAKSLQY